MKKWNYDNEYLYIFLVQQVGQLYLANPTSVLPNVSKTCIHFSSKKVWNGNILCFIKTNICVAAKGNHSFVGICDLEI